MDRAPLPPRRRGFSLIEIMTVVAIMVILSVIGIANLNNRRRAADLTSSSEDLTALIREAQSRSVSGVSGATWGVHVENNTTTSIYALYQNSYSSANTIGYYRFPPSISILTSTIPRGSSTNITFSPNSGLPAASATITLLLLPQNVTSTITVATMGLVSFSSTYR